MIKLKDILREGKGMLSIFDFDDTLAKSDSWVYVIKNGKEIKQKFYYKNGQIRYQKNIVKKDIIEEMYSKDGDLTMRLINGKVEFSLYNNQLEEKKEHNHDHGHHHHDGGHHHHH